MIHGEIYCIEVSEIWIHLSKQTIFLVLNLKNGITQGFIYEKRIFYCLYNIY